MKKHESGRSMVEILGVLAIIGVLSATGLWGYSVAMRHRTVDEILEALRLKTIEINSSLNSQKFTTDEELDKFLSTFTTQVAGYRLSFVPSPDKDGFVSEIRKADGDTIKGAMCRELITKMAEQQFVSDVDFMVEDVETDSGEKEDVTVRLNGKYVNLDAVCGG